MRKNIIFNKTFFIIVCTSLFIVNSFNSSFANQQDNFNPNLPPKITEANAEFVYKFLLAEIATQRGDFNSAGHLYLDLAKQTHSIPLAERATRVAGSSRNGRVALDSAKVWSSLDPKSVQAQQILAELYITSGNLSKAKPIVKKLLEQDTYRGEGFLYLNSILAKVENKKNALRFIVEIAEPYPNSKEAHFAIAHAAYFANNKKLTNSELAKVKKIDPKWQTAVLFEGYIIGLESQEKAINFYVSYLKQYPNASEVRLEYAKLLTNQKKYNLNYPIGKTHAFDYSSDSIINDVSKVYAKIKSSLSDKKRTYRLMIHALLNANHRNTQAESFVALQNTSFKIKKAVSATAFSRAICIKMESEIQ